MIAIKQTGISLSVLSCGNVKYAYRHYSALPDLYNTPCISDIEADFQTTQEMCAPVTDETIQQESLTTKIIGSTMRLIAPLL